MSARPWKSQNPQVQASAEFEHHKKMLRSLLLLGIDLKARIDRSLWCASYDLERARMCVAACCRDMWAAVRSLLLAVSRIVRALR